MCQMDRRMTVTLVAREGKEGREAGWRRAEDDKVLREAARAILSSLAFRHTHSYPSNPQPTHLSYLVNDHGVSGA